MLPNYRKSLLKEEKDSFNKKHDLEKDEERIMQGVLVTAYKDKQQLTDLIQVLYGHFKIFLHIDAKSKEVDEAELKNAFPEIYVIKKYRINWGGVNHLKSIVELLSIALKDREISYFHVISGQDFPVKSVAEFQKFFEKSDKIYMTCFGEDSFPDVVKERLNYRVINANWDSRKRAIRYINCVTRMMQEVLNKQRRTLGEFSKIFKGMVWVSMPRDAALYVSEYTLSHPRYMKDLEHTIVPEEFFFQTILANSNYCDQIVNDNLRYTDWVTRYGSRPAYLDETDIDKIIESNCFFARKIHSTISQQLVIKLKEHF